ncbi:cytochrome c biogenesis protein CcsA [Candidatus Desantisbacteria bacterium]|nr:cytochrome c biogenesis protein CcsA [Candidatus Desantisbacteria bacterium]
MKSYFLFDLCFVIYSIYFLLYMGSIIYKNKSIFKFGKYLFIFGIITHTVGIILKTAEAGHAPLVNMYESLLFFTWSIASIYFILEHNYKTKILGVFITPLIILGLLYSKTLSSEPEPLVPALQSMWLEIHVITSFVGYGAFAIAYGLGLMYLLGPLKESNNAHSNFAIFNVSFMVTCVLTFFTGIILKFIEKIRGILIFPFYNTQKEMISERISKFALSNFILFITFFAGFILIFLMCHFFRKKLSKKFIYLFPELNIVIMITFLIYYIMRILLIAGNSAVISTNLQMLILNTMVCCIIFIGSLVLIIKKRKSLELYLPGLNVIDSIIFNAISFGFPFLSCGIITGAVWANSAWGTYWGWDPKETWSLVTWFVYAAYLHARYAKGWKDEKASYLAIYGFITVIFTYFGVNLFFAGLHSYA